MRKLAVHRLGRVEYEDGLRLMALAGAAVRAGDPPGTDHLFLLEHPPTVTMGRAADRRHLLASPQYLEQQGFGVHETDRGGDVTYHGPGQLVAYPVVDLSDRPDVHRYVAALEEAMIRTCADHGVEAGRHRQHRGAWVGRKKIGAVGVHLSRWITSHGLAFNVSPDLLHFQMIVPCGIADPSLGVTTLALELQARKRGAPGLAEVEPVLARHLAEELEREPEERPVDLRTVTVVPVRGDGRVLLLRRTAARGGFWQPVTGRIEPGEVHLEAASRELREETGAEVPVALLRYRHGFAREPEHSGQPAGSFPVLAEETAFAARVADDFEPRLGDEHDAHRWCVLSEAMELLPFAGLRRAARLAVAALGAESAGG